MLTRCAALLLCLSACAPSSGRAAKIASTEGCAACDELDRPAASSAPQAPSRVVFDSAPRDFRASDRWAVRQIGPSAEAQMAVRPKRTKVVDIDLVRAPFDETARLLSDTGRFNVVVEAPSASPVTAHMKAIEPYDALVILAEARGLSVTYRRGVVVVTDVKPAISRFD